MSNKSVNYSPWEAVWFEDLYPEISGDSIDEKNKKDVKYYKLELTNTSGYTPLKGAWSHILFPVNSSIYDEKLATNNKNLVLKVN